MRVSEGLHRRMRHIDSQRMMIRIEQSKGNRDRDVALSPNRAGLSVEGRRSGAQEEFIEFLARSVDVQ
jgi:integrase